MSWLIVDTLNYRCIVYKIFFVRKPLHYQIVQQFMVHVSPILHIPPLRCIQPYLISKENINLKSN